jgi:hypothetical protein
MAFFPTMRDVHCHYQGWAAPICTGFGEKLENSLNGGVFGGLGNGTWTASNEKRVTFCNRLI